MPPEGPNSGRRAALRGLILPAVLAAAVAAVAAFNRPLFMLINGHHATAADWAMVSLTELGNGLVAALIVLLLCPVRGDITLRAAVAMAAAGLATTLVKEVFSSPRPAVALGDLVHVVGPVLKGNSMPSGHTATVFALAFSLRGLVSRPVAWGAVALAAAVGYSRVYVGAHFPLDVAIGAAAGWAAAALTASPSRRIGERWAGQRTGAVRAALAIAAIAGIWIAFFEPMARHNPYVLGPVGVGGFIAAVVLLVRSAMDGRTSQ